MRCSDTSLMLALILLHPPTFLLADCVHGITDRALKLISAPKFPPSKMFSSRPSEQGIISTSIAYLPKDKLPADQEIPSLQLS
jgi:hypothetical protein